MRSLAASASASAPASLPGTRPAPAPGRTQGRCGIVHGLAQKREGRCAGARLLPFLPGVSAARREHQVGRGDRFFVHVNLVVPGHRHAEFLLDGLFRPGKETFAEIVVIAGSRYKDINRVRGLLHGRLLHFNGSGPNARTFRRFSIARPHQAICLLINSLNTPSVSFSSLNEPLCTTLPAFST